MSVNEGDGRKVFLKSLIVVLALPRFVQGTRRGACPPQKTLLGS